MSHKNRDPELRKNLDVICSKFKKGQFLNWLDFEALGLGVGPEGTRYAIRLLKGGVRARYFNGMPRQGHSRLDFSRRNFIGI